MDRMIFLIIMVAGIWILAGEITGDDKKISRLALKLSGDDRRG